jgi:small subunit ribosomal protein S6
LPEWSGFSLRTGAIAGVPVPRAYRSPERDKMALYEHLLIARQDISAQQVDALATHLKTIVEGEGGKVEKQEYWGLRSLAYRIKKNRKGHYVLLNINAPAKAVQELERQLKINEDVLRCLTVKVEQFEQSSSSKSRREREGGDKKPEAEKQEAVQ